MIGIVLRKSGITLNISSVKYYSATTPREILRKCFTAQTQTEVWVPNFVMSLKHIMNL